MDEPKDLELEKQALSWALYYRQFWDESDIREDDFWLESHRKVWRAVTHLVDENHQVDTVAIQQMTNKHEGEQPRDYLELLLGFGDLLALPNKANLERLKELAQCRRVVRRMHKLRVGLERGNLHDVRDCIDLMSEAAELRDEAPRTRTAYDVSKGFFERLTSNDTSHRVHPGLAPFATHLGLLPVGSVTTIGAATNVGKSMFGLAMMRDSREHDVRSGYISCEDPDELVGARFLAMESGVSARSMQRADTGNLDLGKMRRGLESLEHRPWDLEFCQGQDHVAVLAAMRRLARRGCQLVLVDYIQAIDYAGGRAQDRRNEVRLVANRLKSEAVRLGMALVLFSQFTRPPRMPGGRKKVWKPAMSDLKETGDLENASEFILLLWRDEESDTADIHVRVAKAKSGGVGFAWDMERLESGMLAVKGPARDPAAGRFF